VHAPPPSGGAEADASLSTAEAHAGAADDPIPPGGEPFAADATAGEDDGDDLPPGGQPIAVAADATEHDLLRLGFE
jgi:hypothetical protein